MELPSFRSIKQAAAVLGLTVGGLVVLEGNPPHSYLDVGGVPTICAGVTGEAALKKYNNDCLALDQKEAAKFQAVVSKTIKVKMSKDTNASMVWFAYNVGAYTFEHSDVVHDMNAGHLDKACHDLVYPVGKSYGGYVHICSYKHGKKVCIVDKGLVNRRHQEQEYCLNVQH